MTHREIERKFLVDSEKMPPLTDWPVPFTEHYIVQSYLVPLKGDKRTTSERVRQCIPLDGGPCIFTHTKKVRIGDGDHEENERVISKSVRSMLLKRADPTMLAIVKMRRVFEYAGWKFELDSFHPPFEGLEILEVELPSMDAEVQLPPFIPILREVTTEREYTNAALSRKGRWP